MPVWAPALMLLLLAGCNAAPPGTSVVDPITQASAFIHGEDLYARATLDGAFSRQVILALRHGEPMQATYRFHFLRRQTLWPDLPLAKVTIRRRIRLRLITKKYEMHDMDTGQIHYTSDPEKAIRFFGNPRFVLLGKEAHLKKEAHYELHVEFEWSHQGMSPQFQTLKRWLNLDQTITHSLNVDYTPS